MIPHPILTHLWFFVCVCLPVVCISLKHDYNLQLHCFSSLFSSLLRSSWFQFLRIVKMSAYGPFLYTTATGFVITSILGKLHVIFLLTTPLVAFYLLQFRLWYPVSFLHVDACFCQVSCWILLSVFFTSRPAAFASDTLDLRTHLCTLFSCCK